MRQNCNQLLMLFFFSNGISFSKAPFVFPFVSLVHRRNSKKNIDCETLLLK